MRRPRSSLLLLRIPGRFASMLLSAGCASEPTPSASDADSGMSTTSTSTAPASTSEPADDTSLSTGSDTGSVFLPNPDLGNGSECDYFAQDCAPGLKCMPWSNDGGSSWNSTRCSPIAEDPAGIDEPCRVEISGTSGLDDCDLGLMCWYVEPKTNEGLCIPLCIGSEIAPYCSDPGRACNVFADASVAICRRICDPLEPACDAGQACHFIDQDWQCSNASGDAGAYGEPCEYVDGCDPGLACMDAAAVPRGLPCEGAAGCCTDLCDVDDPAGDLQCAGAAEGATCHPWYDEDEAPLLFEHVGVCRLPVGA